MSGEWVVWLVPYHHREDNTLKLLITELKKARD